MFYKEQSISTEEHARLDKVRSQLERFLARISDKLEAIDLMYSNSLWVSCHELCRSLLADLYNLSRFLDVIARDPLVTESFLPESFPFSGPSSQLEESSLWNDLAAAFLGSDAGDSLQSDIGYPLKYRNDLLVLAHQLEGRARRLELELLQTPSTQRRARWTRHFLKFLLALIVLFAASYLVTIYNIRVAASRFIESPHGIRVRDLMRIREALERYHKAHGAYPSTLGNPEKEGWDGIFSCYGRQGEDWIRGLAPQFIETLPRDPRNHTDCESQYLYRSDGMDYKLIAHSAPDIEVVKKHMPWMEDPKRIDQSYGFWTRGARGY